MIGMIGFYPYDLCWNRHFLPLALVEPGRATSRCQRTAERLFGCGAAAVAGGNIHPLEGGWAEKMMGISAIFHQGLKDTCNLSDLPKNVVILSGSWRKTIVI